MPTLQENLDRYDALSEIVSKNKSELDKVGAKASLHREQYEEQKAVLNEKGFAFASGSELNALFNDKKQHFESLLDEFENRVNPEAVEDELD